METSGKDDKEESIRSAYDTLFGYLLAARDQAVWARMLRHLDLLYEAALSSLEPSAPDATTGVPS